MTARVVLLAGPSGSGKTSLTRRVGLPMLALDDFYRDADDARRTRRCHAASASSTGTTPPRGTPPPPRPPSWSCAGRGRRRPRLRHPHLPPDGQAAAGPGGGTSS